jgi:HEAT repeat protein
MLDLNELQEHILAIEKGDDTSRRQTLQALKHVERSDWAAAPVAVAQSLVAALQQQLQSGMKPPWIHKEIAIILGNMAPRSKPALPQLIQLLHDGIPDPVRETAAKALGHFGKDAKDAVDQLVVLSGGRTALAVHAVRALGEIGVADPGVRAALVNLWLAPSQSQNGQGQVAIALCKLKIDAKGLLGFLTTSVVANQDHAVRKSAAEALAWRNKNDVDVVPALLTAALNDRNEEVRQIAQTGLNQLQLSHEKAIQLCAKQLKDSSHAEAALRKSGQLAVPALTKALESEESTVRIKATQILAYLGEVALEAVPALTKALHDRDSDIRLAAAKGVWNITKKADLVVPVLVHLLEEKRAPDLDGNESRRRFLQTVIEALWRIGPPAAAALPALKDKTKDPNRMISESARNAIGRIVPTAATK